MSRRKKMSMNVLEIGSTDLEEPTDYGALAYSANTLARSGLPVPYSLALHRNVLEEFLVETGAVHQFFAALKKGKPSKAASLITSTSFPTSMKEMLFSHLAEHDIKEFDVYCSSSSQDASYRCLCQRRKDLFSAIKACWAYAIEHSDDPFSGILITKHISTSKHGLLYSHHPLNNSRAHCVIHVEKPSHGIFYVNKQNGTLANPKDFHRLDSPLHVTEKDALITLAQQLDPLFQEPIIVRWMIGDGAYVLSYRTMTSEDRNHFLNQSSSS